MVVTGCCDVAARCRPGDVFVARLTARGDGHDEVPRAIARGASGVVAERMLPTAGRPLCIVPEGSGALSRIAHALAGNPARRLHVVAVTGTSGKTTTAWLAASVLAEAGFGVGVLSDLGCLDAEGAMPARADIARPHVLAAWLRRLADGGCTHAVVEVSSAMLAAECLAGIQCDTVVVTNVARAHLDAHGTAAAYRAVKARILDCLAADGCLVTDIDGRRARELARRRPHGGLFTTGLRSRADVNASPVERGLAGQTVLVRSGGHVSPLALSSPVTSFVRDALLATAVGLRAGVPLERIVRGIEAAGGVPGRVERIDRGQPHAVFVDQPTSRHALRSTLASLRRLTPGRLVVLSEPRVAARIDAEGAGRRPFERCVRKWADDCVVVPPDLVGEGDSPTAVLAYARIDRLLAGLRADDCLLVTGAVAPRRQAPTDPEGEPMALATVVDGWLQLAHQPRPWGGSRRAA
jgi:UDP-N-acetylmuramoyl-L-alanyl-D-glutamate--2,6-diaminopimelate ligase